VNDYMPRHVVEMAIKGLNDAGKVIKGSKVLIMGLTYKENVPDTRESPAREMVRALQEYKVDVYGYDPLLSQKEIEGFGVKAIEELTGAKPDAIILAVAHEQFRILGEGELARTIKDCSVVVDVKGVLKDNNNCTL
jgi:UDPglucose 6-dehydrogenase/UDP-N-acetyl-D-galactosamine dehydrogenase